MNHAHQSITNIHLTRPGIIEIARNVMGSITLDPCTSEQINAWSVNATYFFDRDGIEGLKDLPSPRNIKVWCNPPGGKTGNKSNMKLWLEAVYSAWLDGKIEQAFFLFFNREFIGGTETVDLSNIPMLHFYDRLKYWSYDDINGHFAEGNWTTLFQSQSNPKPVYSAIYCPSTDCSCLSRFDENGKFIGAIKTQKDAERWARENNFALRVWTNSPTHPSTLAYFPPRTNSGWSDALQRLEACTPPDLGRWVIPQIPSNLGAK
jgi:hypothetical protein